MKKKRLLTMAAATLAASLLIAVDDDLANLLRVFRRVAADTGSPYSIRAGLLSLPTQDILAS